MENQLSDQRKLAQTANWNRDEQVLATCKKIDKWVSNLVSNVGERPVTTTINVAFDDDVFDRLEDVKEELGLTWQELVIQGSESLVEEQNIATEVN